MGEKVDSTYGCESASMLSGQAVTLSEWEPVLCGVGYVCVRRTCTGRRALRARVTWRCAPSCAWCAHYDADSEGRRLLRGERLEWLRLGSCGLITSLSAPQCHLA